MSTFSFYGGKAGQSFDIEKSYLTKAEMITDFQQGSICTVSFGGYVIIDTSNKSDSDNGKLYKRGFNYSAADGGAEYVTQIVGPKGEDGGLHVIGELASIAELPVGGPAAEYKGWFYTIENSDGLKIFYTYDYNLGAWYSIGVLQVEPKNIVHFGEILDTPTDLRVGGMWFVLE